MMLPTLPLYRLALRHGHAPSQQEAEILAAAED